MEMHQVRYFLAVARHFNFTRAAEELQVAQPSLTRAIQKLETELGAPLFRRERSNTHLTELGRMMLPHLQTAFAAAETAKSQARRLKKQDIGSLALGICSGIDAARPAALVLATARRLARLDLSVEVASSDVVEHRLMAGEFDAAVLAPFGEINGRLDLCPIVTEDLVVVFAEGHRFADQPSVALDALQDEPLVLSLGCRFDDALGRHMEARGLTRQVRHRSNDPCWIAQFVRNGLGCAVVPAATARAHALDFRPIDGFPVRHRTVLATVAGRRHSAALAALIQQVGVAAA